MKLTSAQIDGAKHLTAHVLAAVYQPYLGKTVSLADLGKIAADISELYRQAGFHLTRTIVPPQEVKKGRVRFKVIEGQIADVVLKGDPSDQFGIKPLLAPIVAEAPSTSTTVERQLLLANEQPGVRIANTVLEEIGTSTGRFRLTIYVETWRAYTAVGIDNLGSAALGPWQAYSTSALNSIFLGGDVLKVSSSTVPNDPRELVFGKVAYDIPIGIYGIRLGGSILHSDSRPGDDRRQFDTQTLTDGYELKAAVAPLLNQRSSLWLAGSLGYLDASERDTFGLIYKDHVRTVGLTADYKFLDEIGGSNYLTAIFRQGLDVFGASQQGEDFLSRFGASGQFSVVDLAFSRYQRVTDEWSFKFSGAGQWSSSPLLNSQQFYLGGLSFGRGYGAGEVSGDNALAGSIEARFDQQVQTELLKGYQLYTFVDSGRVWNVGDSYSNGITLTSVGAGIRFYFPGEFQAGIAIAAPLTYRSPNNDGRDLQVLVSFSSALKVFCNKNNQWACL